MNFAITNHSGNERLLELFNPVIKLIQENGDNRVDPNDDPDYFLNFLDIHSPRAITRRREEQKIISVTTQTNSGNDLRASCFQALVKSLSNMLFCVPSKDAKDIQATYTTPESGYVKFPFSGSNFCNAIKPVTHSRFVLRNRLIVNKDFSAEEIRDAEYELATHSKKLDQMGIVPSPYPLKEMLTEEQVAAIYRLYKVKGLSYGNMSLRRKNKGKGKPSFWMTARGVDKANIRIFGKDFLLVEDYDEAQSDMVVSVPEDHDHTARVSADAIEHYMIYKSFPKVGAIVHVHAWIDGVEATNQNYPCGSSELASSVVSLLKDTSKPIETIIGLKNHGLTITGPDLDNIFNRITGKLRTEVPMKL